MTRSSVKELIKPFDDPDIKEASEEEVTETMVENTAMEEYMNEDQEKCSPEIARPTKNRNKGFVVRG